MRKFNLTLAAIAFIFLVLICSYNVYLLRRPVFVRRVRVDQELSTVAKDISQDHVLHYEIGRSILEGLHFRKQIAHYRDGELVERHFWTARSLDFMLEDTKPFAHMYIYSEFDEQTGECRFGFGSSSASYYGLGSITHHITLPVKPDSHYHHPTFVGPDRLRFEKNKPLTLAILAFSDQVWSTSGIASAFDRNGVLKPEALQHGDFFLMQFEFVDSLLPED